VCLAVQVVVLVEHLVLLAVQEQRIKVKMVAQNLRLLAVQVVVVLLVKEPMFLLEMSEEQVAQDSHQASLAQL
jgi:hypothetical protein